MADNGSGVGVGVVDDGGGAVAVDVGAGFTSTPGNPGIVLPPSTASGGGGIIKGVC